MPLPIHSVWRRLLRGPALALALIGLAVIGLVRHWWCQEDIEIVVTRVPDGHSLQGHAGRVMLDRIAVAPATTPAGAAARDYLQALTLQQKLSCRICRRGQRTTFSGRCWLPNGSELEPMLVKAGLARDCPAVSGGHLARAQTWIGERIPLPDRCRPRLRRGPWPAVR
ncbi:hypothetical protein [Thiorhodovibrio winogradskyi]|uniref:hypothetical protein n=1 Tax=Thiorhodovibrio winogradskyi TaxID=77007 RepID=UPI002E2B02DE|nr:hypothetical protein [Thiorhodovibrio winogradskyi]